MSEDASEYWRVTRADQRVRREERLGRRQKLLDELTEEGFEVRRLTEWQFRINGVLDIYPLHHRYHDLKKNRRGGFQHLKEFVKEFFKKECQQKS